MKKLTLIFAATLLFIGQISGQTKEKLSNSNKMNSTEHYTFKLSDKVTRQKVTFKNRYGITLSGDFYQPKNAETQLSGIVISGPFGAIKEQSYSSYANQMAERGFAVIAFDLYHTGENGGEPRNLSSSVVDDLKLKGFIE